MDFSKSYQEGVKSKVYQKEADLLEQDDIDHIFSQSAYASIGNSFVQVNSVQNSAIQHQFDAEIIQNPKLSFDKEQLNNSDQVQQEKNDNIQIEEKARESIHSNIINLLDSGEEVQINQNMDLYSFENYGENEIDKKFLENKRIENANKEIIENNINNLLEYVPDNAEDQQNSQFFDIQAQTTALSAKMLLESSIQSNNQLQIASNNQPEIQKGSQQIQLQKQGSSNSQKNLISSLHQNIIFEDDEEQESERDNKSMQLYKERDQIIAIDKSLMTNRIIIVCEPELITEGYITTYKLYRVKSKIQQYSGFDSEVLRRFSDFEWLYNELVNKYGGYLIPLLPEKNILTKFNIETADFTKDRQKNLEFFLQKLLDHQKLQTVPELKLFLFAKNEVFSLVKGEAESQKTIEQKYQNVIGSVKNYFQQSIVPFFGYSQEKGQEIVREQTELDKDLNNYEAYIQNLAQKMHNFLKVYECHFSVMDEELKYLNELNTHYSKYIESTQKEIKISNRHQQLNLQSEAYNQQEKSNLINQKLINLKEDYIFKWRNQFQPQLEVWYKNCIAAQEALNRRKEIIITIVNHSKRIQELNLQNKKNNNQRDTEMDILYNNLVKNQQKLENINKILVTEIKEYDENQQQQFEQMINLFIEIEKDFHYKQNEIYHGREPNII
ncbi:PX-SNX-like domain protein (macronuclear) [Tetrahymena thermophila SB210]|uniref:PX-SNX-like domain protein n=1 Tax=Tetrahymena thermophila (strain SB210) TaxID=312017 RepID=I7M7V2_TETTS|nr:PX-SNX-like domain protein [Tetrahymena thermophila SB210]EAR96062.2 PX-SNX-like domain protein [Tetrahymena thermophila SB210]|eukprot:XP_001016307.2 PX-SNX-like domain protein [Tetrahymena thermophila SB210]